VIAGVFLLTLLVVSIVTVRISDMVLDSRVGALDRTLGFLFGLARGLIIVVVAFMFFSWLVPDKSQPDWVKAAKSRVVLTGTGQWLMSMLPEDPESTILKKLKRRPEDTETPENSTDRHSQLDQPAARGETGIAQGPGNRALR
jgi:membrane protein required for colicin V production